MLSILRYIGHLNFIKIGNRIKIINLFYPSAKSNVEFKSEFFGAIYEGNLNNYIDWNAYFFGAYEKPSLLLMKDILSKIKEPVVLDIGANIGHHSLFFSKFSKKVFSFEPYELVRKSIEQKIKTNKIENITIFPFGLSDKDETLNYYEPNSHNNGTGSFINNFTLVNNSKSSLKLQLYKGDTFIFNNKITKVDFIKIDVEGFERNVLLGLKQTLERFRPIVVIEYSTGTHNSFLENNQTLMDVFPSNYSVKKIKEIGTSKYALVDFDKIEDCNLLVYPDSISISLQTDTNKILIQKFVVQK